MTDKLSDPMHRRRPRNPTSGREFTLKKSVAGDSIRDDRLMMRMHQDLVLLLTARAEEAGLSRSRYIETVMLNLLRLDPRNPKMDAYGRINVAAPPPDVAKMDPHEFYAQWARYEQAHQAMLGMILPKEWIGNGAGRDLWEAARERLEATDVAEPKKPAPKKPAPAPGRRR